MIKNQEFTNKILIEIKNSKKYKDLTDEIIQNEINKFLNKNPKIIKKNKIKKTDISKIKANLHRIYASYQTSNKNKRIKLINQLIKNPKHQQIINDLLKTHRSTKERLPYYKELYEEIFKITKKPKSISDIGCGLNPISIPLMNIKEINYHAYDIEKSEIKILNDFFKIMKINGTAKILDSRNLDKIKNIPDSNITFIFKLIDLIDTKKEKISEDLIKLLIKKSNFIVASFATKTISGKNMNLPKRIGFELMLKRNNLKFKTIEIENEIFYLISK